MGSKIFRSLMIFFEFCSTSSNLTLAFLLIFFLNGYLSTECFHSNADLFIHRLTRNGEATDFQVLLRTFPPSGYFHPPKCFSCIWGRYYIFSVFGRGRFTYTQSQRFVISERRSGHFPTVLAETIPNGTGIGFDAVYLWKTLSHQWRIPYQVLPERPRRPKPTPHLSVMSHTLKLRLLYILSCVQTSSYIKIWSTLRFQYFNTHEASVFFPVMFWH